MVFLGGLGSLTVLCKLSAFARYATIHCGPDSMSWKDFTGVVAILCSGYLPAFHPLDHTNDSFSYHTHGVMAGLDMLRFFVEAICCITLADRAYPWI